jgi:PAS domain S-box-containing protein
LRTPPDFRNLIENALDVVYRQALYPERVTEYVGGAVEALTGRTAADFYADPYLPKRAVHPDDAAKLVGETAGEHIDPVVTVRWIHPDGRVVWAEHRRVAIVDATGRVIAIEGIARDVTDEVQGRLRLQESERQLRELAARVLSAREEERTAVARELHDELGQTMTAIKLELNRAVTAFAREHLRLELVDRLQSLAGMVDIGLATVKRIATNLRPPTLDHLGLPAAIEWEASSFGTRTGLRCVVAIEQDHTALSSDQQTAVFRIFQEALTNVVRHAHASAVRVTLSESDTLFTMQVRDTGAGISAEALADPRAIGLLGMRERAALIGGTLVITGRQGRGTTVSVRVPISSTHSASPKGRASRRKPKEPRR